jgi:hypothetical protein
MNMWHTTEFKVTIENPVIYRDFQEMLTFASQTPSNTEVFYAGIYESKLSDLSVEVLAPDSQAPSFLWLDSYEAVDWKIRNVENIVGVIVSSHKKGSTVFGVPADKVMHSKSRIGYRGGSPDCHCVAGRFRCEGQNGLPQLISRIETALDLKLGGYSTRYGGQIIAFSDLPEDLDEQVAILENNLKAQRLACEGHSKKDADRIFKRHVIPRLKDPI